MEFKRQIGDPYADALRHDGLTLPGDHEKAKETYEIKYFRFKLKMFQNYYNISKYRKSESATTYKLRKVPSLGRKYPNIQTIYLVSADSICKNIGHSIAS